MYRVSWKTKLCVRGWFRSIFVLLWVQWVKASDVLTVGRSLVKTTISGQILD